MFSPSPLKVDPVTGTVPVPGANLLPIPATPVLVAATPAQVIMPTAPMAVDVLPQEAVDGVVAAKQEAADLLVNAKKQALVAIDEEAAKKAEELKLNDAANVDIATESAKIALAEAADARAEAAKAAHSQAIDTSVAAAKAAALKTVL